MPIGLAVGDVAQRPRGVGERVDAPMCGVTRPVVRSVAQFVLVAGELVGGDVLELKAEDLNSLDQNQVQRNAGDDARGVADGDEAAAAAQRPQCGFGQLAADRVDDGVGAVGQRVAQRGAQVAVAGG